MKRYNTKKRISFCNVLPGKDGESEGEREVFFNELLVFHIDFSTFLMRVASPGKSRA